MLFFRNTRLALRHCSENDLAQQWVSTYNNNLYLRHYDLYLSYGDSNTDYPLAERHQYTEPSKTHEQWYGQDNTIIDRIGNFYDNV